MEQRKQIVINEIPLEKPLTKLEVEAIVEVKLDPYKTAINPDSAPYLSVAHFLWGVGILVTILSSLLGYIWKKMNDNNKSINDRVTRTNDRLHTRVDETHNDIEEREDKLRSEFNNKCDRLDDRLWKVALHLELNSGDIVVINKKDGDETPSKTPRKK